MAVIKEYAIHFKPEYIFWLHNEGDLQNLAVEQRNDLLRNYIVNDFSQNLIKRQSEIDMFWEANLVEGVLFEKKETSSDEINRAETNRDASLYFLRATLTLSKIRETLGLIQDNFITLEPIFSLAKKITEDHGIKLYLVHLPMHLNAFGFNPFSSKHKTLAIAKKLDIPVIDFIKSFNSVEEFRSILDWHYDERGYSLLADAIEKEVFD